MKIYRVYKASGSDSFSTDNKPDLIATTSSVINAVIACQVDANSDRPSVASFRKVRDALLQAGSCIFIVNRISYLIVAHFTISETEDDELYYCQSINMDGVNYEL